MAITSNGDKFLYGGESQQKAKYPWRTGAAQAKRPSAGTPYGAPKQELAEPPKPKQGDYSAYAPQSFTMPGYQTRQQADGSEQYMGQSDFGNFGNMPVSQRPLPFTAQYRNFDGSASDTPNYGQRDAFIQNINDSMLPYYGGKSQGAPQFDFQNMWKSAGDMVQNGWQNPFSEQTLQQIGSQAPQQMYQPQSDQRYGVLRTYADRLSGMNPMATTTMYYNPATGMASHQPPQPTSMPNDPYAQFRADDSGMLYQPGVNAPLDTPMSPVVYMAQGSKSERPMTYNQTTGMYEGTQGWGQYQRPISLSPQEAAGLPTASGLLR